MNTTVRELLASLLRRLARFARPSPSPPLAAAAIPRAAEDLPGKLLAPATRDLIPEVIRPTA
jgi:hypothetical protein